MPYSEAQKRAALKYRARACDRIETVVHKGMKEVYQRQAAEHGLSLSAYIISLLERDRAGGSGSAADGPTE